MSHNNSQSSRKSGTRTSERPPSMSQHEVYLKVLQAVIVAYRSEPRFRTAKPSISPSSTSSLSPTLSHTSKRQSFNAYTGSSLGWRSSHHDSSRQQNSRRLSKNMLANLDSILKGIAMKTSKKSYPESTKRCLLSFLAQMGQINGEEGRDCSVLIASYSKIVVKEMKFIKQQSNAFGPNNVVYSETLEFIKILIQAAESERNSEPVIAYLKETQKSMEPPKSSSSSTDRLYGSQTSSDPDIPVEYPEPSFSVQEMPQAMYVAEIFGYPTLAVQHDIDTLKHQSSERALEEDLKKILAHLHSHTGRLTQSQFVDTELYHQWRENEFSAITNLLSKLKRPTAMPRQDPPSSKKGIFYVIPDSPEESYLVFLEACLKHDKPHADGTLLFTNATQELLNLTANYWRITDQSKAALLFSAANNTIINMTDNTGHILDIDTDITQNVIIAAANMIKKDEEREILEWPEPDRRLWSDCIRIIYSQTMKSIDRLVLEIFNPTPPRFNAYIILLMEFIFEDPTFEYVEESGLVQKWQEKLRASLGKAIDAKYSEVVNKIPSDTSISFLHVYEVAKELLSILQRINKRYKNPLLGFLEVSSIVSKELCRGFGVDLKPIMYHLLDTIKKKEGSLDAVPFEDAVEIYKVLCDVRHVYLQVEKRSFPLKLEKFFYPFMESFVISSEVKIKELVNNAFLQDTFEVFDEEDPDRVSESAKNCLRLFNQNLKIIQDLDWQDEYQSCKLYTILVKGISEAVISYAYKCLEVVTNDLNETTNFEEEQEQQLQAQEEESNAYRLFGQVRAAVTGSARLEPPKPYRFKSKTCILLNNIGAMLEGMDRLEEQINPEKISNVVKAREGDPRASSEINLFSIKIVRAENLLAKGADGFSDTYVVLTDSSSRTTIGKTIKIDDDLNPQWNEEFEFAVPLSNPGYITATIWDDSRSTISSHEIVGRATVHLDPRKFNDNGIPRDSWYELDTEGRILISISMESEKVDAVFCLGRAHRSIIRIRDRIVTLMVDKFSRFIFYSISRPTLKTICGNNGQTMPDKQTLRSAIVPLGNYLNSNLEVLAESLTQKMMFKVMLEAWHVILKNADQVLLPPLSVALNNNIGKAENTNNLWKNALASLGGTGDRSLTQVELEVVFEWLKILCVEFFYAGGEGLPLEKLRDSKYQRLLLVPVHYVTDKDQLIGGELSQLIPHVNRFIREKNYYGLSTSEVTISRAGTLDRSKTIMAQGTSRARAQAKKEVAAARSDPLAVAAETEDVILRVLIAKGEKGYVANRLKERETLARITQTEILAQAAAKGIRIN